jgi:uncharacterized protein YcsI (UPF0317 family)
LRKNLQVNTDARVSIARDARLAYRLSQTGVTAGVAPGFVQGNLAILPKSLAASFYRFCQLNPKPCPCDPDHLAFPGRSWCP